MIIEFVSSSKTKSARHGFERILCDTLALCVAQGLADLFGPGLKVI